MFAESPILQSFRDIITLSEKTEFYYCSVSFFLYLIIIIMFPVTWPIFHSLFRKEFYS